MSSLVVPDLDRAIVHRWRRAWDEVMAGFLPGADSCEAAVLAVAEAAGGGAPARVLDLGGGPGVFAERMAQRWPGARVGVLDLDPVLLALAAVGAGDRLDLYQGDLETGVIAAGGPYDLITAVMTVHYLAADQARALYRAAHAVLRPGGLLVVADLMPEPGLSAVMDRLHPAADEAAAGLAWTRWWDDVSADGLVQPILRRRQEIFADRAPAEFTPPVDWHREAAREAGFGEAGIVWRWGAHAALAAVA
jgi:SAM-dependent methyltransferase